MVLLSYEELRSLKVLSTVACTLQAMNCCIMLQANDEVSNSVQEQPAEAPESAQQVLPELTRVSAEKIRPVWACAWDSAVAALHKHRSGVVDEVL